MMSGTPVVSFQVGGLVDIVIDGKTGVITKNFDTVKLASNIDKCIKNEIKKSLQTRNFALANFSSAVVAAKYISFIDYLYK
jgi:glycosyltransferase involved in cell wall biosynthesis